jgi:purine-binding chemotaxis protein CheW
MDEIKNILLFTIDDNNIALQLSDVARIIHSVEITPLPEISDLVLGIINLQSEIIPVFDLRKKFSKPGKETELNDRFIIVKSDTMIFAVTADSIKGITEYTDRDIINIEKNITNAGYLDGTITLNNEIVLICDLKKFFDLNDEKRLLKALTNLQDDKH